MHTTRSEQQSPGKEISRKGAEIAKEEKNDLAELKHKIFALLRELRASARVSFWSVVLAMSVILGAAMFKKDLAEHAGLAE